MKTKLLVLCILLTPAFALAQIGTPPSAGLTPQSPFYFIDRLGEVLQEFFAFNPDSKIRVQIGFAAERIAEIQVEMTEKNINPKGLSVAQSRLEEHLTKASNLVDEEEKKGRDVKEWSETLKEEFEVSKQILESSFELAKDSLENERELIKEELEVLKKSGDDGQIEALKSKLDALDDQKDELELRREEQKQSLEKEREELDDEAGDESDDLNEDSDEIEL